VRRRIAESTQETRRVGRPFDAAGFVVLDRLPPAKQNGFISISHKGDWA
jgi:hypothetical protein